MIKTLLKAKLYSFLQLFFYNSKTKKKSSIGAIALKILLGLFLVFSAGMLGVFVAVKICKPLCLSGLSWLYFAMTASISSAVGLIGSVFMTYSTIYEAKDNDMLLSMPIYPRQILLVRMSGCYLMTLLFEAVLFVPTVLMYFIEIEFSSYVLILSAVALFIMPLLSLSVSCLLAWLIALIMPHIKNKSMVRVVTSLVFLIAYYVIYFNASSLFQSMLRNSEKVGGFIEVFLYPLALLGYGIAGNITKYIISLLIFAAVFAVVYFILTRNFFRLATAKSGVKATHYKKEKLHASGVDSTLLRREFLHFKGSPVYMLNCGLGILMLAALGVVAFIKGGDINGIIIQFNFDRELVSLFVIAALCLSVTMCNITAPSISIEGSSIFVLKSMPVFAWRIIVAKIKMHLILTLPVILFASLSLGIVFKVPGIFMLLIPATAVAYDLFYALAGIALNLLKPNVHFPNETAAVKQNITAVLTIFGSMGLIAIAGGAYYLLDGKISAELFLTLFFSVLLIASFVIWRWLRGNSEKRFYEIV